MSADVESMFSAREVPWHGLGVVTEDNLKSAEALSVAGLDWTVEKRTLFASLPGGKSRVKVDGKKAVMRSSDNAVLGIVSDRYNLFQNVDAFTFMDSLVDSGEALYETAGSLRNGKSIFVTMRIPDAVLVGGEDRHDVYLVLKTSHDGTGAVKVIVTPVRVVCTNTMMMALDAAQSAWSVTHNSKMSGRVDEARRSLSLSFDYMSEFKMTAEELMRIKVSDDQFYDVVQDLFEPHNKNTETATELVMDLWKNSPTNGYHGTGWGGFNAMSEFFEHYGRQRSLEARFGAIMGWQADFRKRTADRILELA